jgi:hypothetical protein
MEPIAADSRARLCRSCDKPVYDSKSMTRAELHTLIMKTEGVLPCLRLHRRPDGTIVTKGCVSALYRSSRTLWLKAAALAVGFWSAVVGLRSALEARMATPATPASSIAVEEEESVVMGLGTFRKPRDERPAWLRPPQKRSDIDRAPPLRHLASEEELLPPAWRD